MKIELFNYFTTNNIDGKKSKSKWLEKNNNQLYIEIINWCNNYENLKNIEFKRKVYHYINEDIMIPNCPTCGNSLTFIRVKNGYNSYCSDKCVKNSTEYKIKWLETWKKSNSNNEFISKRIKTCIEKYGSIEEFKKEKLKKVVKNTNEKYGVDYYILTDEFKKNRKNKLKVKY